MKILGISCYFHDSAACLIEDGELIAAAQEERFTRIKQDPGFPTNAIRYCMAEASDPDAPVDGVIFYEKPLKKFHRLMETYFATGTSGLRSFVQAVPVWIKEKLWIYPSIQESLEACGLPSTDKIYFCDHHESHAASAFYPSPFEEAAILTLDGVGEWSTLTIGIGEQNRVKLIKEIRFPHSLGLLYSAFTYFTGFRVNSGEYKLMGLAPYGEPIYKEKIKKHLIDLKEDGSFRLNMDYFSYVGGMRMTNEKFAALFGGPERKPESPITKREMDLARSIQEVTEEIILHIATHAHELTGKRFLCMAGGVALNCVANGRLLREGPFEDIWIQPAAGDAGGALGAALTLWHNTFDNPRQVKSTDSMKGAYLGPAFSEACVQKYLDEKGYIYKQLSEQEWPSHLAELIDEGKVIGLHQGRMEYGPRALGNRSIVGDPRSPKMQSIMNLKIKYRESFRPFAPSCLEESIDEFFALDRPSPYMLLVAPVKETRCIKSEFDQTSDNLIEWINQQRSDIPAITHVDYSARVQSVNAQTNPRYHALIKAFQELTGYGIIINTSFNVRGEPIVCTPEDAYRCFMRTEIDYLSIGSFLLKKTEQPNWEDKENWQEIFKLD